MPRSKKCIGASSPAAIGPPFSIPIGNEISPAATLRRTSATHVASANSVGARFDHAFDLIDQLVCKCTCTAGFVDARRNEDRHERHVETAGARAWIVEVASGCRLRDVFSRLISTRIGTSMCVSTMIESCAIFGPRLQILLSATSSRSVDELEQAVSRITAVSATLRMCLIRVNIDFDHSIRCRRAARSRNEFPNDRQRSAISRRTDRDARRIGGARRDRPRHADACRNLTVPLR